MKVTYHIKDLENQHNISIGALDISNPITITIDGSVEDVELVIKSLKKDWHLT